MKRKKKRNSTLEYYDKNADQYLNKTLFLDLSGLYKEFEAYVTKRGRILDAGCGVGRDTRYFIEHGYTVISLDASKEMVRKCNEYPHAFCLNISFEDLNFNEEFDGIWCCGSLLHLTSEEGKKAIRRLTTSLKVQGVMFVSLKKGEGNKKSEGRFFQYYNESSVGELYKGDLRLEVVKVWVTKSLVPEERHDWVNLLLRRK
jgi:2-polyprenyl-3-methyl-5-hydroxy-6-metoxy-1,4-benzoquinol methylase